MSAPSSARILLVEDDRDTRDAVSDFIEDEGFDVRAVRTVSEAISLVDKESFSLILTDVWDRGVPRWPEIEKLIELADPTPVAACTASRVNPPELLSKKLSFFLEKPFAPERLLQLLSQYAGDASNVERFRPLVVAYFDALTRKDWKKLASICTEDVGYFFPAPHPTFGKQVRGLATFLDYSKATFDTGVFADAKFELQRLLPLYAGAVADFTSTWNHASEPPDRTEGSVVFRFQGEKICRIGVRLDMRKWAFA